MRPYAASLGAHSTALKLLEKLLATANDRTCLSLS